MGAEADAPTAEDDVRQSALASAKAMLGDDFNALKPLITIDDNGLRAWDLEMRRRATAFR